MNIEKIIEEGYNIGMAQNKYEIKEALNFLIKKKGAKNFMEIGTDQGGMFYCLSKISDNNGIKISLDLPFSDFTSNYNIEKRNKELKKLEGDIHILEGDSHKEYNIDRIDKILDGEKLDFLFIDGDHKYEGVKLDFHMYKKFVKPGGWIGFHDIKETQNHKDQNALVFKFWKELQMFYKSVWFLSDSDWGGIGFIENRKL